MIKDNLSSGFYYQKTNKVIKEGFVAFLTTYVGPGIKIK